MVHSGGGRAEGMKGEMLAVGAKNNEFIEPVQARM